MQSYHVFDRHERRYVNPESFSSAENAIHYIEYTYTVSEWPLLEVHRATTPRSDEHQRSYVDVRKVQRCPATPTLIVPNGEAF